jgi:GxxExxY protein
MLEQEKLTETIIGAAIEVHRETGPGLLESAYEACLTHELTSRGLAVQRQQPLMIRYKGVEIDCAYRMDLVVEGVVLIELKAVAKLDPIHEAQLLTYMKLANLPVGLLMNFNVKLLTNGIKRFARTRQP